MPLRFADFTRTPQTPFAPALQALLGLPETIPACSGTAALVVALHALRQREPKKNAVVVPAYSCPLVPLAVKKIPGLRPVVCDVLPGGFDLDPEKLKDLCSPKTLAAVPVHLGGKVADLTGAQSVARAKGVAVIEDAAQSLGAFDGENSVGLAGDAAFFSLAAGKGLTTYEGGVLFSRDPDLNAALRDAAKALLGPNFLWSLRRNVELLGYLFLYSPARLALTYGRALRRGLDAGDEERAVGDRFALKDVALHGLDAPRLRAAANALERLPDFLKRGRDRAARRLPVLRSLNGVAVIEDRPGTRGTWPFFMLLMPGKEQRDKALGELWKSGLGVSKLFVRALPDYDFLHSALAGQTAECPNARDLANRMLTVSNTGWMDETDFARIAAVLERSVS